MSMLEQLRSAHSASKVALEEGMTPYILPLNPQVSCNAKAWVNSRGILAKLEIEGLDFFVHSFLPNLEIYGRRQASDKTAAWAVLDQRVREGLEKWRTEAHSRCGLVINGDVAEQLMSWLHDKFTYAPYEEDGGWELVLRVKRDDTRIMADESVEDFDWIAVDGDHSENASAIPLLDDDEVEAAHVSDLIHQGQQLVQKWVIDNHGILIVNGGDNALFKMKPEGYYEFEQFYNDRLDDLRKAYYDLTGFTLSCGVGHRPSECDKALLVAKNKGRDQIVFYSPEVEQSYQGLGESLTESDEQSDDEPAQIPTSYKRYVQRKPQKTTYFKPSSSSAALAAQALKNFKDTGKDADAMLLRMSRRVAKRLTMSDVVARKILNMIRNEQVSNGPHSKQAIQLLGGVKLAREVRRFLDSTKTAERSKNYTK